MTRQADAPGFKKARNRAYHKKREAEARAECTGRHLTEAREILDEAYANKGILAGECQRIEREYSDLRQTNERRIKEIDSREIEYGGLLGSDVYERHQLITALSFAKRKYEEALSAAEKAERDFDAIHAVFQQAKIDNKQALAELGLARIDLDNLSHGRKAGQGRGVANSRYDGEPEDQMVYVGDKPAKVKPRRDGSGIVDIYFGGVDSPDGVGHGHIVFNGVDVEYMRQPFKSIWRADIDFNRHRPGDHIAK